MPSELDLVDAIRRLGWSAQWGDLVELAGEHAVRRACTDGVIVRVGRGRYALPDSLGPAQSAALRVNGTVPHLSAAMHWGIAVRKPPAFPSVTVPRGRKLTPRRRLGVEVRWADLSVREVEGRVTTPLRTVLDCA